MVLRLRLGILVTCAVFVMSISSLSGARAAAVPSSDTGGSSASSSDAVNEFSVTVQGELKPVSNSSVTDLIQVDKSGEPIFNGSPNAKLEQYSNLLSDFTNEYPDIFAGVSYASDYSCLVVFAKSPIDKAMDMLSQMKNYSELAKAVKVVEVSYSEQDLQAMTSFIAQDKAMADNPALVRFGRDVVSNRVVLQVKESPDTNQIDEVVTNLAARIADKVTQNNSEVKNQDSLLPVNIRMIGSDAKFVNERTRYNDYSPFYMGGSIIARAGTSQSICSTGIPITVNGVYTVMTAGHCGQSRWLNPNGRLVGLQYTTAYPGNARIYGDWKLLYGQHYANAVFSGPRTSSRAIPITGGSWSPRAIGSELCMSGQSTGAKCRLVVQATRQVISLDGVRNSYITVAKYDPNRNGSALCSASAPGDSGGTVYFANGRGGAYAYGIHKGKASQSAKCHYFYTEVAGVRAWKSNARVY